MGMRVGSLSGHPKYEFDKEERYFLAFANSRRDTQKSYRMSSQDMNLGS